MKSFTVAVFVTIVSFLQIFAEEENVSIIPPGETISTTEEEIAKRTFVDDEDELEELVPMMFRRASSKFGGGDYTSKEQKKILAAHNDNRKLVTPVSSDMNEMLWSSALAEQAQTWSDGCVYEHPDKTQHPDYNGIGQNLYIKWLDRGGKKPPPVAEPVDLWYGEVKDYHYTQNSCNSGAVCGHFTQVVWAETTKVGCGITFCPLARSSSSTYENAWVVTCNYSPAGNMRGTSPYKAGDHCSSCEKGFCKGDLCSKCKAGDRGCECNLECQNRGTLNTKKCKCACRNGFYGPACENQCADTDSRCGGNPGWPAFWCDMEQFAFVREKCPALCGVCNA